MVTRGLRAADYGTHSLNMPTFLAKPNPCDSVIRHRYIVS